MIIKSKLITSDIDLFGYTTYVFRRLGICDPEDEYIMCTKFPNWLTPPIEIGEVGYLDVDYIYAGDSTWFNGKEKVPYRYNMVQFKRFIVEKEDEGKEFIM